jgi:hypothetical protein
MIEVVRAISVRWRFDMHTIQHGQDSKGLFWEVVFELPPHPASRELRNFRNVGKIFSDEYKAAAYCSWLNGGPKPEYIPLLASIVGPEAEQQQRDTLRQLALGHMRDNDASDVAEVSAARTMIGMATHAVGEVYSVDLAVRLLRAASDRLEKTLATGENIKAALGSLHTQTT